MNQPLPQTIRGRTPTITKKPTPRQRKLTGSEIDNLIAQYKAGCSTRELAVEFGVHRHTISRHLTTNAVRPRANQRRLDNITVDEAKQLYEAGWTLAQLAAHYKVGQETVRRELRNTDLTLRPRGGQR